jgi:hypothetical protein
VIEVSAPHSDKVSWVSVKSYGTAGDGVTNDASAISNAITAAGVGGTVYFPKGTYLLNTGVAFLAGQKIIGDGYGSVIKTTSNIALFTLDDNCIVEGIKFLGSYDYDTQILLGNPVDASISSQKGVFFNNKIGINISNIWCEYLGGYGIDFTTNTTVGRQYTSSIISDIFCTHNLYGVRAASQGEFVSLNSIHSTYNAYGLRLDAGNIHVNGGNFSGCVRNIWMTAGTNHGKHTITGAVIAHSSAFTIYMANIENGAVFSNCQISYGIMSFQTSQALFTGCEIHFLDAANDYIQCGNAQVSFVGCTWGSLRPTISDNVSSLGYSDINFIDCKQRAERWICSTSGTTATTVYSYLMIDNTAVSFDVEVLAYDVSNTIIVGRFRRRFLVNKKTGAPTVENTEDVGTDYKHADFSGIDIVDPAISSNSVIIQVTGKAATSMRWKAIQHSEAYLN